jgi:hypothetical protein
VSERRWYLQIRTRGRFLPFNKVYVVRELSLLFASSERRGEK